MRGFFHEFSAPLTGFSLCRMPRFIRTLPLRDRMNPYARDGKAWPAAIEHSACVRKLLAESESIAPSKVKLGAHVHWCAEMACNIILDHKADTRSVTIICNGVALTAKLLMSNIELGLLARKCSSPS